MEPQRRRRLADELREAAPTWADLAARHGTPLLVLDPREVQRRYAELQELLPYIRFHYAVKALPHPAVIAAVVSRDGWFDAATSQEVDHLRTLGVDMRRVVHTHPVKKSAHIDHAFDAGVRTFVVDSIGEVEKFDARHRDAGILVRLAFPDPTAKSDLSAKFGVSTEHAELVVKQLLSRGMRVSGFSFHVGSQGRGIEPFARAIDETIDLMSRVESSSGIRFDTLDIGGGFPVSYREFMPSITEIASVIDTALAPVRDRVTVLAEPGRYVVASAATLLTSVVGSAERDGQVWHYLDDGVYGSYSNVLAEDVHPAILTLSEIQGESVGPMRPVVLAGPTCDSVDVVARDYPMPHLAIGSILVSPMMGAYTAVSASRFNGLPPTPIVVVR
ncbi:ornithine decarboxylase [Rhodococcoides trifolii]|uniref:Ornithine decarboxylase n=1 Tax=Rhodococcoides trifolii TaxID=908250 RepID=A0A917FUV7_9NOCA|nr:type III PLP-dependent enzyme [Rhodococcus trifolii]GGG04789.1 ornithine decarboxylase [Rhodococcus trifolii]